MSDLVLSEKDLMTKVATGDEESFRQLFLSYHQQLGIHVFRITNSIDLAEAIVQDIFLEIWTNREMLNDVENFRLYLFAISKNYTLDCLKKNTREHMYTKACGDQVVSSRTAESGKYSTTHCSSLDDPINKLPPQQEKALLTRHERLRYAEAGKRMNKSHGTVKRYLKIAATAIITYVQAITKRQHFNSGRYF